MKYKHLPYDLSDPFNGVINYLRVNEPDKFNNFLTVEVNSIRSGRLPRNAIDGTEKYWIGEEGNNSYIKFSLPYPVKTNGYLIRTSNNPIGQCHPKSWKFEASLDGVQNTISKDDQDYGKLNNPLEYAHFVIEEGIYQTFKITPLTSHNSGCTKRFDINEFEIYGTIIFPNELTCSHKNYVNILHFINLMVVL